MPIGGRDLKAGGWAPPSVSACVSPSSEVSPPCTHTLKGTLPAARAEKELKSPAFYLSSLHYSLMCLHGLGSYTDMAQILVILPY